MSALEGIRVVEVASYQFVPAAAAVLADLGADVIKVEQPPHGDPHRSTPMGDMISPTGTNLSMEQVNRGKRSVALNLSTPEGLRALQRLCETADVFVTNFRVGVCERLGIGVEAVRSWKPDIIYARGVGLGSRGPDSARPSYDITAYWARGGVASAITSVDADQPVGQRPGFGDKQAAMNLAFGVAAALVQRARTGEGCSVEVSLLGSALWVLSSDLVSSHVAGHDRSRKAFGAAGPTAQEYCTADGRWIRLNLMGAAREWLEFCDRAGRSDLIEDRRFLDPKSRTAEETAACLEELRRLFASATLAEWRKRFDGVGFAWEVHQNLLEVLEDPQVEANDYLADVDFPSDVSIKLVQAPVKLDGRAPSLRRSPRVGEDTDSVLGELAYKSEEIAELRERHIIL
jgi:crotonobetainyl-CoA:carnitine CoA-transferase CaiB-like acyl-CoA transferase